MSAGAAPDPREVGPCARRSCLAAGDAAENSAARAGSGVAWIPEAADTRAALLGAFLYRVKWTRTSGQREILATKYLGTASEPALSIT